MLVRRSLMPPICSSRSFWVAAERGAAGRGLRPLGLQPGQLPLHGGEARRLGQRGAPVLQLGDGRVEVLDRQQVGQAVRHEKPS